VIKMKLFVGSYDCQFIAVKTLRGKKRVHETETTE